MTEELITFNVERLETPKGTLSNLRPGAKVFAPRNQRDSIKQAIARLKDESHKRYSIRTLSDYLIEIKRVK